MSEIQTTVGNFEIYETEICIPSEVISFSLRRSEICLFVFMLLIDYQSFLRQVLHGINTVQKEHITLLFYSKAAVFKAKHTFVTPSRPPQFLWVSWWSALFSFNTGKILWSRVDYISKFIKVLCKCKVADNVLFDSHRDVKMATTPLVDYETALLWFG